MACDERNRLPSFSAPIAHDLLITNCPDPRTQSTQDDASLGEASNAALLSVFLDTPGAGRSGSNVVARRRPPATTGSSDPTQSRPPLPIRSSDPPVPARTADWSDRAPWRS